MIIWQVVKPSYVCTSQVYKDFGIKNCLLSLTYNIIFHSQRGLNIHWNLQGLSLFRWGRRQGVISSPCYPQGRAPATGSWMIQRKLSPSPLYKLLPAPQQTCLILPPLPQSQGIQVIIYIVVYIKYVVGRYKEIDNGVIYKQCYSNY